MKRKRGDVTWNPSTASPTAIDSVNQTLSFGNRRSEWWNTFDLVAAKLGRLLDRANDVWNVTERANWWTFLVFPLGRWLFCLLKMEKSITRLSSAPTTNCTRKNNFCRHCMRQYFKQINSAEQFVRVLLNIENENEKLIGAPHCGQPTLVSIVQSMASHKLLMNWNFRWIITGRASGEGFLRVLLLQIEIRINFFWEIQVYS